jgi:hypothetical protein
MAATGWAGEAEGAGAACVEADSAAKVRHSQAQGLSGVMVIPGQWGFIGKTKFQIKNDQAALPHCCAGEFKRFNRHKTLQRSMT